MRRLMTVLLLAITALAPVPPALAAGAGAPRPATDGQVKARSSKHHPVPRHHRRVARHTVRRAPAHRTVTKVKAPAHRVPATRAVATEPSLV